MIHRAADHHVDILLLHDVPKIFISTRLGKMFFDLGDLGIIHIAHRHHVTVINHLACHAGAAATTTHERDTKTVVFKRGRGDRGLRKQFFPKPKR